MIYPDNIARAKALATEIQRVCNNQKEDCENCPFHYFAPVDRKPHVFCGVYGHPFNWQNIKHFGESISESIQRYSISEVK